MQYRKYCCIKLAALNISVHLYVHMHIIASVYLLRPQWEVFAALQLTRSNPVCDQDKENDSTMIFQQDCD